MTHQEKQMIVRAEQKAIELEAMVELLKARLDVVERSLRKKPGRPRMNGNSHAEG